MRDERNSLMISNPETEKSVLYCLMYFKDLQSKVSELQEDDFYNPRHKEIFNYFKEVIDNADVLDPALVPQRINKNPEFYAMMHIGALKSHFREYIEELKEKTNKRKLGKLAVDLNVKVQEDVNSLEIKNIMADALSDIKQESKKSVKTNTVFEQFESDILNKENFGGLTTGLPTFDNMTKGFCPGTFNIVGGTPAVGKTTFILNIANYMCAKGKKVLYVSLEMDYIMLYAKLVSIITGVSVSKLLSTKKNISQGEWTKIMNASAGMEGYNLFLMGEGKTHTYEIENEAKTIGADIVFVDYLQLVSPESGRKNRYEEISGVSRDLKKLATKLNIPIVAVASINRAYNARPDKKPVISDLRDSGNIEYDADMVIFLYRESITREPTPTENVKEFISKGELILAKNRYGICNMIIDLHWDGDRSLFRESI